MLEVDDWSVTSTSHHFGLVAQSAERLVVCGSGASARPPGCNSLRVRQTCPGTCFKERGSPSPQETIPRRLPYEAPGRTARSVAANALGLGPRERRCKSCRADHFQLLSRITVVRPPVKRDGAGVNPAWGANLHAPVAQNTERRRPKARVVGESPAWSATEAEPAEAPGRS